MLWFSVLSSKLPSSNDNDSLTVLQESVVGKSRVHRIDDQQIDAAFRRIKPNFMGFHIWKLEVRLHIERSVTSVWLYKHYISIQNDRIETVPADKCGIFHDRDTYIIYAAAPADTVVTPKTVVRIISRWSLQQ